jgi:hypothetical protein
MNYKFQYYFYNNVPWLHFYDIRESSVLTKFLSFSFKISCFNYYNLIKIIYTSRYPGAKFKFVFGIV